MKLYYSPGACSLCPHIVLRESGLPFELVLAPTRSKKLPDGSSYLDVNPKGQVPALGLDNGQCLTEVAAIVQYIADQAPDTHLAPPAGSLERYRLMEWLNYIGTELHKSFGLFFMPSATDDIKATFRERLQQRLAYVDSQLAGRQYLMGDHFTVADAYLFVVTGWAPFGKVDLAGYRNLMAWRERVAARPGVQAAVAAEKG